MELLITGAEIATISDADDEIWEVTLSLNIGDTIEYKFSRNWTFKKHLILTKIVPMGFLILLIECLLSLI